MSAAVLAQLAISGLAAGVAYALVAVGITVVGGLRGVHPLANGDVLGGSLGLAVLVTLGAAPLASAPTAPDALLIVALSLAGGGLGGALLWLASGRPDRGLQAALAALAAGVLIRDALAQSLPRGGASIGDPLHLRVLVGTGSDTLSLGGATTLPARLPGQLVLGALLLVVVAELLRRSAFGRGVRALAQDPELAALCGVDPRRTTLAAYLLAGLLAAVGGLLAVPGHVLGPDTGVLLGLTALLAAVCGGVGSVRGATAAALVIGLAEAVLAHAAPAAAAPVLLGLLAVAALSRRGGERWEVHYR